MAYRLLSLTAISGEFPTDQLNRLPGSPYYLESVVTALKKDGLLRTYYRDKLRGYRLGPRAKATLLESRPDRFASYLTGDTDTNRLKCEIDRRLRLHRLAETYVTMDNAGVCVYRDEKPAIFAPEGYAGGRIVYPAFFSSREVKEMGIDTTKIRSSRSTGILLAPSGIFVTYNSSSALMKWRYKSEMRVKALIWSVICQQRLSPQFRHEDVHGLILGNSMDLAYQILTSTGGRKHDFFMLDGSYEHFLYAGGFLAQLLGNYATWKQGGGIPGDGTSPLAASPDFLLCLSSVLRPPYGVYGILICIGLLAVLLIMVMRMGYGDAGEYDEDRNFSYSAKGTYGTSGWMSRKEMSGVLDLVPDLRKHKGVVLGMLDGKAVCIPEDTRINSNLAVYGASGSMKTRSFCMNRILQATVRGENGAGESLIICDPKSELYEKSSEFLRSRGYCVKVFNLVSPENSDSWCCLAEVEGQELMAQLFVDVIIKNTTNNGKSDHFWDACEMNLLKALVLYVDQGYAEENRNIGEVYRLLTLNGESQLDTLFEALPSTHPAKAPYSLFKQASDTVRSGVIIGLGSRLQVFQSELIKKITAKNEIDLELPGQQPCAYFLVTSDQDSTFDFLASLFLSFCFIKLVRYADHNCEGGKLPVPVHILGEELTACGTIPDLSRRLSVIRSRNISMSCVFQNLAGLQNRYPQNLWQEIIGNCDAQLFLGCTDQLTAEFISARTGLASVAVSSKSKQLGTWRISNYTPEFRETSGVGKRPVLTPDEVLRLPLDQALIIIRGKKVLQVDKMDYSKHPEAKYLRSCKASAHVPEWRRLEEEAAKTPQPAPKPAPAAKKPAKRKATKPASPIDKSPKEAPAPKSAGTPEGIITTDKDSILS